MSNFLFLQQKNSDLFNIIAEAEKLFRDEYFEQSIVQTRRFAENLCKDLLKGNTLPDETFDSMINRIKDNSFDNIRMQEFTDDLFFLKKHGNASAHSSVATKDGKIALECLERAFEVSVFYSNVKYGYRKKIDKLLFSEELLMTGNKAPAESLKDKYSKELKKSREKDTKPKPVKASKSKKKKEVEKTKVSIDKTLVIMTVLALIILAVGYLLVGVSK